MFFDGRETKRRFVVMDASLLASDSLLAREATGNIGEVKYASRGTVLARPHRRRDWQIAGAR
jgi:hypothetical protein